MMGGIKYENESTLARHRLHVVYSSKLDERKEMRTNQRLRVIVYTLAVLLLSISIWYGFKFGSGAR
ncbi:hypothetical protein AYW79_06780 [Ferroacidibacillus organovorans]|uniref:Uncharacterized protein n=1 Tax=Ferroacidibacillus organovorans TaxID=1765683 RepID=A0A853KBI1_9BACL|nr:hypothetical protein AYJ22_05655 [Ferroacidibacillus organovorans]OAG94207.1 hypothetical protein AYW79_06780 [Ferroacidibacillus organovorans]